LQSWFATRRRRSLWALGVAGWALPLTHYWGFALVTAACASLAIGAAVQRNENRRGTVHACAVLALGVIATCVWWPILRFQSAHTGTPWTRPSTLREALKIVLHRGIGRTEVSVVFTVAMTVVSAAGLVAATQRRVNGRGARHLAQLAALTWVVAFAFSYAMTRVTESAFVARYAMTMFPLQLLLATFGLVVLRPRRGLALAGVVWALGTSIAIMQIDDRRTRSPQFADALAAEAQAGDVVVYCPDQLGPPLQRLIEQRGISLRATWTYPDYGSGDRVDWIDYRERYADPDALAFARTVVRAAGEGAVWLVLSETHPPTEAACARFARVLRALRPQVRTVVPDEARWAEHDVLLRYPS
jgi:hypothetical protein